MNKDQYERFTCANCFKTTIRPIALVHAGKWRCTCRK